MEATKKVTDKPAKRKTFQLCFVNKGVLGRSNISPHKPLNTVIPLTSKFHVKLKRPQYENLNEIIKSLQVTELRDKYEHPLTENQRYGWYTLNIDHPNDKFKYGKRMHQIMKENMMNFAKIRD